MNIRLLSKIALDLFKRDRIDYPKCDILTFACDSHRNLSLNGKYYSPLINTLEEDLARRGVTSCSISRIDSRIRGSLAFGQVISPNGSFARALLSKRARSLLFHRDGSYPYSKAEERIWRSILEETGAQVVVGILPSRELCTACHKRGVWVADMQHGVIAKTHPWYGEDFRASDNREWLPDAFLCWDQRSAEVLNQWAPDKGVEVLPIGNIWVSRFIHRRKEDSLLDAIEVAYGKPSKNQGLHILVTLGWGAVGIPNGFLHPALEKVILESGEEITWMFRLHPAQLKGFAENELVAFKEYFAKTFTGKSNIEWGAPSRMPLPLLLSAIDLHITWTSSVCIEAAHFGLKSLTLDPALRDGNELSKYFENLKADGYLVKGLPESNLIKEWIQSNKGKRIKHSDDLRSNYSALLAQIDDKIKQRTAKF